MTQKNAPHAAATALPLAGPEGVERAEAWVGEIRVNLIRLASLVAFYAYHLINVATSDDLAVGGNYHLAATGLALVWSVGIAALYFLLSRRPAPTALAGWATVWDLSMVTALVLLAGGPRSPLLVLYFIVIAAAPLRLIVAPVYVATLGAVAAYAFLLGHYVVGVVGYQRYYASPELRVPRTQQAVLVLALLACGTLAGQAARQARRLAQEAKVGARGISAGAELRLAGRFFAAGLSVMVVLVGIGLLLPALGVGATRSADGGKPWAALLVLGAVFVVAVGAAFTAAQERHEGEAAPNSRNTA